MEAVEKVRKSVEAALKRRQIATLKSKAKSWYLAMQGRGDSMSCGHALASHISSGYAQACIELDKVLDELATLDPKTPTQRFSK